MRERLRQIVTALLRRGASLARGRIAAALLVAGALAAALAAACATGVDNTSGDDGGGDDSISPPDGIAPSEGGLGPEGSQVDRMGVDVPTCTASGPATTCAAPATLGPLMPTQMMTSTGNLVPLGQDAYLSVAFTGNTSASYHPSINLTQGATEFVFDVLSDCSGTTLPCGDPEGGLPEAGASTGLTTWEVQYTGGDFTSEAAAGTDGAFEPIPAVGSGGTVIVHVYRRAGLPLSCNQYTLTVGN